MKIGITYEVKEDFVNQEDDYYIDFEPFETITRLKSIFEMHGHEVQLIKEGLTLEQKISLIKSCDLIFNYCEGYKSRNREALLPAILEKLGKPYVGSDAFANALTTSKSHTKVIAKHLGIKTPEWIEVYKGRIYKDKNMAFPRIVKPNREGNSGGLYLVNSIEEQSLIVEKLSKIYDELLIEEFIDGREITVPVIGSDENADALVVIETLTSSGRPLSVYSREEKADDTHIKVIAGLDSKTEEKIKNDSLKLYTYLKCADYARLDYKLVGNQPYFLEINLLPSLTVSSSFFVCAELIGMRFDQLIMKVLESALARTAKNECCRKDELQPC